MNVSCHSESYVFELQGKITKHHFKEISRLEPNNIQLDITSAGGDTKYSLLIALYLSAKNLKITVKDHCLSACASILLPVSDDTHFIDKPLIGFHWSTIMNMEQQLKLSANLENCDLTFQEIEKNNLEINNLNYNFWKETEDRLGLEKARLIPQGPNSCPLIHRKFTNEIWLPTSKQLRELWGLKFKGGVCADDYEACSTKINKLVKSGTHIVVGNKMYISREPNLPNVTIP